MSRRRVSQDDAPVRGWRRVTRKPLHDAQAGWDGDCRDSDPERAHHGVGEPFGPSLGMCRSLGAAGLMG